MCDLCFSIQMSQFLCYDSLSRFSENKWLQLHLSFRATFSFFRLNSTHAALINIWALSSKLLALGAPLLFPIIINWCAQQATDAFIHICYSISPCLCEQRRSVNLQSNTVRARSTIFHAISFIGTICYLLLFESARAVGFEMRTHTHRRVSCATTYFGAG
jgi:hypothetical protein